MNADMTRSEADGLYASFKDGTNVVEKLAAIELALSLVPPELGIIASSHPLMALIEWFRFCEWVDKGYPYEHPISISLATICWFHTCKGNSLYAPFMPDLFCAEPISLSYSAPENKPKLEYKHWHPGSKPDNYATYWPTLCVINSGVILEGSGLIYLGATKKHIAGTMYSTDGVNIPENMFVIGDV